MPTFTLSFPLIMSALFHDIKQEPEVKQHLAKARIPGTNFDEILYADDTICISTDPKAMNTYMKYIQTYGRDIGLNLNKKKCEVLNMSYRRVRILFDDGSPMKRLDEAKYLGCLLNDKGNPNLEVKARISSAMHTWKS